MIKMPVYLHVVVHLVVIHWTKLLGNLLSGVCSDLILADGTD